MYIKYKVENLKKKKTIYRDFKDGDVSHSQVNIEKAQKIFDCLNNLQKAIK